MNTTIASPELELIATELAKPQANSRTLQRNGKIARLPKTLRDMVNHMLDDGLPYHVIIDELGEFGKGLNAQNLTNWRQGGYQDYLKQQEALDRARAQVELAVQLMREAGDVDLAQLRRACNYVAALQLFDAMRENGDQALKKLLQQTPSKYLNVVHTLCHQSNSALKLEKHHLKQQTAAAATTEPAQPSTPIKTNQAPAEAPANCNGPRPHHSITPSTPSTTASSPIKANQVPAENEPLPLSLPGTTTAHVVPLLSPSISGNSTNLGTLNLSFPGQPGVHLRRQYEHRDIQLEFPWPGRS